MPDPRSKLSYRRRKERRKVIRKTTGRKTREESHNVAYPNIPKTQTEKENKNDQKRTNQSSETPSKKHRLPPPFRIACVCNECRGKKWYHMPSERAIISVCIPCNARTRKKKTKTLNAVSVGG